MERRVSRTGSGVAEDGTDVTSAMAAAVLTDDDDGATEGFLLLDVVGLLGSLRSAARRRRASCCVWPLRAATIQLCLGGRRGVNVELCLNTGNRMLGVSGRRSFKDDQNLNLSMTRISP